ncbi:hypothetical protein PR003_g26348 [Phytophthora rubi]|uniref:Uncharacterized protein n=1 Tax=Phytophthora rubi TaxID=129364 RepID=A0A6A3I1R0_9STRA|nr:hypothetical protein PR001_g25554 [Phytophthora rubi]KAE8977040.1 hypothetical protein PR002_g25138 [Phytophthora rubi]KAE9286340.1 hypothetical protein PR003_g26348 [Phytophthora rubi]
MGQHTSIVLTLHRVLISTGLTVFNFGNVRFDFDRVLNQSIIVRQCDPAKDSGLDWTGLWTLDSG